MFVSERMATDLITAGPELSIFEAKELMGDKSIRHLPIVDKEGKIAYVDIHDIGDQPDNEELFDVLKNL